MAYSNVVVVCDEQSLLGEILAPVFDHYVILEKPPDLTTVTEIITPSGIRVSKEMFFWFNSAEEIGNRDGTFFVLLQSLIESHRVIFVRGHN